MTNGIEKIILNRVIGIIDYGAGNIASVQNALESLSIDSIVCSNPRDMPQFIDYSSWSRCIFLDCAFISYMVGLQRYMSNSHKKAIARYLLGYAIAFSEGEKMGLLRV